MKTYKLKHYTESEVWIDPGTSLTAEEVETYYSWEVDRRHVEGENVRLLLETPEKRVALEAMRKLESVAPYNSNVYRVGDHYAFDITALVLEEYGDGEFVDSRYYFAPSN